MGNIHYEATEEEVLAALRPIGTIINFEYIWKQLIILRLKKHPTTKLNTGIGFCEFKDKQTADEARKMNDKKQIRNRPLHIDTCQGKGTVSIHVVCAKWRKLSIGSNKLL